jgi:putative ABC transport system substrate-binding protein
MSERCTALNPRQETAILSVLSFALGKPMRRRQFINLLGGAAAWPLAARAQHASQMRRVGVLMAAAEDDPALVARIVAFRQRLELLGWKVGTNLQIDFRWPGADVSRLQAAAGELTKLKPDVIVATSTPALAAAQRAALGVSIVFVGVSDPVQQGFVTTLSHPGGNITGFTNYEFSIGGKWVGLLKEFSPALDHIGFMFKPDTAPYSKFFVGPMEEAASPLGVRVTALPINDEAGIEAAVSSIAQRPNGGLIIATDVFILPRRKRVTELAARHRVPAIYSLREYVDAGGLMAYGLIPVEQYRAAAVYVDRILKGTNPGDLPIQLPAKFELLLNIAAARVIEHEFPINLMLRADEVIG